MELQIFIVLFILLDLLVVISIFVLHKRKRFSPAEKQKYLFQWKKIKSNQDFRTIIEADKLLDILLKKKGYHGTVGEKLKKSGKLFSDIHGLWDAHKLRNRLAHELDVRLTPKERDMALSQFEKAFRDLGIFS